MLFKSRKSSIVRFVLLLTLIGGMSGVRSVQAAPLGTDSITTVLVVSFAGAPLGGRPVYAFNGNTYTGYSKTTNANGEAALTLPEGNYRFRADVDGTQFWSGPENHCYNCLSVVVTVPEPVLVAVQNTDGMPMANLNVYAFNGATYTGFHGTTDENGQRSLRLPEGNYRLRADLNGTQFWSGTSNHCAVPGCTSASITVSKPMTVTIFDTDGAPKAGLNVYAFNGSTYTGYNKVANVDGQAIFTLPLGSYRFRADLNGTQFWSGTSNHCTLPGCESAQVTVTVPLTVMIQDGGGAPKSGVNLYAFNGSTYTGYSKVSNTSGQAIFTLPLGSYRFRADYSGAQYWSGSTNHCTLPGCLSASVTVGPAMTATALPTSTSTATPAFTPTATSTPTLVTPVTRVVTNTNNSGPGSLRQAILDSASNDTVAFAPSLAGQTITLTSSLIINKALKIDGSGLFPQVTISGGNVANIRVSYPNRVMISDLTIVNGHATNGGAIESTGYLSIINSTLRNNVATSSGGAILSARGLTLINSTIYQNQAGSGGAILVNGDLHETILINSTITQNQASSGGALYINGGSSIDVFNSTIAGNSAATGAEYFMNGGVRASFDNTLLLCTLVEEDNCYFQNGPVTITDNHSVIAIGPLASLSDLDDNGGPTKTMALLPGSSLIDAGDDSICSSLWVNNMDQRGVTRPQGAHCDIGAYEYDGLNASTTTTVTASPNPSESGQIVTVTARVSSASGAPTGTVDFSVDETVICTKTLMEGVATCDMVFTESKTIVATYHPDSTDYQSSSDSIVQTVGRPDTMFIQVVKPNGGEVLAVGASYRITWISTPDIDKVTIGYQACANCLGWIATGIPNIGYYDWEVSVGNTTNTQFTIYIIGYDTGAGSTTDVSDNYFTVVEVPPTYTPIATYTPTPANTPTEIPTNTPIPVYTPTFTPTPGPTPVLSCNSIRDSIGTIKLSLTTMYLDIPNPNPYPVTISDVFVAWNYDKGHLPGDSRLFLESANLNGTIFWTGSLNQPSALLPLASPAVLPASTTSRITFNFNQTYLRASGGEQIQLQFSTPGCEAYPVVVPLGAPTITPIPR